MKGKMGSDNDVDFVIVWPLIELGQPLSPYKISVSFEMHSEYTPIYRSM